MKYTNGRKISMVNVRHTVQAVLKDIGADIGDNIGGYRGTIKSDRDGKIIRYKAGAGMFRNGVIVTVQDKDAEELVIVAKFAHDDNAEGWGIFGPADVQTEDEYKLLKSIDEEDKVHFPMVYNYGKIGYGRNARNMLIMAYVPHVGNYTLNAHEYNAMRALCRKYGFGDMHEGNYGGEDTFVITDCGI